MSAIELRDKLSELEKQDRWDQWLFDAIKFVRYYNALPKSARKNGKVYTDRYPVDSNFEWFDSQFKYEHSMNIETLYDTYIEVLPCNMRSYGQDSYKQYNNDNDLVIRVVKYTHQRGPIDKIDVYSLEDAMDGKVKLHDTFRRDDLHLAKEAMACLLN